MRTRWVLRLRPLNSGSEANEAGFKIATTAWAQEEGSEELMEPWARLLANAMDPNLHIELALLSETIYSSKHPSMKQTWEAGFFPPEP
jgi:hypothetical protein